MYEAPIQTAITKEIEKHNACKEPHPAKTITIPIDEVNAECGETKSVTAVLLSQMIRHRFTKITMWNGEQTIYNV